MMKQVNAALWVMRNKNERFLKKLPILHGAGEDASEKNLKSKNRECR